MYVNGLFRYFNNTVHHVVFPVERGDLGALIQTSV